MIAEGSLSFDMISFDRKPWYEIDTIKDLTKAEKLFSFSNPLSDPLSNLGVTKTLAAS